MMLGREIHIEGGKQHIRNCHRPRAWAQRSDPASPALLRIVEEDSWT